MSVNDDALCGFFFNNDIKTDKMVKCSKLCGWNVNGKCINSRVRRTGMRFRFCNQMKEKPNDVPVGQ